MIDSVDKNGIALGRIYSVVYGAPGTGRVGRRGTAFVPALLRAGLAKLDRYAEEGDGDGDSLADLQHAQDFAKLSKTGVWSIPEPEVTSPELDDEDATRESAVTATDKGGKSSVWSVGSIVNVRLSEIVDGTTCYLNSVVGEVNQLTVITEALAELAPLLPTDAELHKGNLVALKFIEKSASSSDAAGYWCRGTIVSLDKEFADVYYTDYGNRLVRFSIFYVYMTIC